MQLPSIFPEVPFYFLRHGQTDWNLAGRLMGQQDIPLNTHGIGQAKDVAILIKQVDLPIQKILSSPLVRAKETAAIINEELNVALDLHSDLQEVSFGVAEGKSKAYGDLHNAWMNGQTPEGAEDWPSFKGRVINRFVQSLECNSLIVAHGGVFSVLMETFGYPDKNADNCVPYIFTPPISPDHDWCINKL